MNNALFELIYLGLCFIAIAVASILIYKGVYGATVFYILGITLFALTVYIVFKKLKK